MVPLAGFEPALLRPIAGVLVLGAVGVRDNQDRNAFRYVQLSAFLWRRHWSGDRVSDRKFDLCYVLAQTDERTAGPIDIHESFSTQHRDRLAHTSAAEVVCLREAEFAGQRTSRREVAGQDPLAQMVG